MNNEGGKKLIGKTIWMWKDGKYGRFHSIGTVVDYRKPKKIGKLSIKKGLYFIEFDNGYKSWETRSNFTVY